METFWQSLQERYQRSMSTADPRTDDWFLIKTPWATLILTTAYLVIVALGPRFMKNRQPFDLKFIMIAYNFALVLLNLYISIEIISSVISLKYNWSCDDMKYSQDKDAIRLASGLWWFYFSKVIEFLDTFIFILRKKNNQISFLHVYHHATMVPLWWIGIKWYAGGVCKLEYAPGNYCPLIAFFSALCNSIVHVVMYLYYFLSAFGDTFRKFLWWKKYLTMFQLAQFWIILIHVTQSYFVGCDYDWRPQVALFFYLVSHILLFSNFYSHAYKKPPANKSNSGIKFD